MSVAVSNAAGACAVSAPGSILSVATVAVVSMFRLWLSCVVIVTVPAATFDDGVSTFVMVNTCSVACAMPLVPHVNFSSRSAVVYVIVPGTGAPVLGVVKAMAGTLAVPAEMAPSLPVLAASVNRHPACTLVPRLGMTIFTRPLASTRPAVLNFTVATDSKPGVSVAVSNDSIALPATRAPAAMSSVANVVGPSITIPSLSFVVTDTVFAPTIDDGVYVFVICIICCTPAAIEFVAVTIINFLLPSFDHVVDCSVAFPVLGVVHDVAGDSNDQPDCTPVSCGITISILPPTGILPAGVYVTVATCLNPGESVAVSNFGVPPIVPALIAPNVSRDSALPPSTLAAELSSVSMSTKPWPTMPEGVSTLATVK